MKELEQEFDNAWARLHKRHEHVEEFKCFFLAGFDLAIEMLRSEEANDHFKFMISYGSSRTEATDWAAWLEEQK